jgi:shikimate kinase
MRGRAAALGAGTVLNALATGTGSAFAIDAETTATVELTDAGPVAGEVAGAPDADTRLIERCVELVVERHGTGEGGRVRTDSDVPMAAGLKSSSAAANATVLATLAALDVPIVDDPGPGSGPDPGTDPDTDTDTDPDTDPASTTADAASEATGEHANGVNRETACRVGVEAARDVGVTVTGAFDDASASMLGGVTVTDNDADRLLARDTVEWDVLVWTPPERAYTADADVDRCARVAPMAELVADLAMAGRYATAMTVNGLAFSAALDFPTDPAVEAMPHADGVSLSGTGPSVTAVGDRAALDRVADLWAERPGRIRETTTRTDGARTLPVE